MSNTYLAFFTGLIGSVHCIGMCGPLAFAIPLNHPGWMSLVFNKIIYQAGRIVSYCLLGGVVGLAGHQIWNAGFQQSVSIISGLMILILALSRILNLRKSNNRSSVITRTFNKIFSYALKHKANHLIIGMINGLLPCGFVYLALAGALNTESVIEGVNYMFWFGMGTVPLMLGAGLIVGFSGRSFRNKLNRVVPYAMLFLAIWFILRGLELNIPFLSPQIPDSVTSMCK